MIGVGAPDSEPLYHSSESRSRARREQKDAIDTRVWERFDSFGDFEVTFDFFLTKVRKDNDVFFLFGHLRFVLDWRADAAVCTGNRESKSIANKR